MKRGHDRVLEEYLCGTTISRTEQPLQRPTDVLKACGHISFVFFQVESAHDLQPLLRVVNMLRGVEASFI